jgi:hypothetical protein
MAGIPKGARTMARSIRRTPIVGMTTAEADKPSKAMEHRRERRAVKAALKADGPVPDPRAFGNPCASEKDGKQFLADPEPRDMRK